MKWLLIFFLLFFNLLLLTCSVYLFFIEQTDIVLWLGQKYHFTAKQKMIFETTLLSPTRFYWFRLLLLCFSMLCLIISSLFYKYRNAILIFSEKFIKELKMAGIGFIQIWKTLSKTQLISFFSFFVLLLGYRVYLVFQQPFHVDEISTYLYFTSKGFLVSASYYPSPNNHILYSLLTCFTGLFTSDAVVMLKLPAFILGMLNVILIFILFRLRFSFNTALTGTIFFSLMSSVNYYTLFGRGYTLEIFCLLLAIICLIKITGERSNNIYYSGFIISNIMGFYTIPAYLYAFAGLSLWYGYYLYKNNVKSHWKAAILSYGMITTGIFILYLPVILLNGLQKLIAHDWIQPYSWGKFIGLLPEYLLKTGVFLWDMDIIGQILLVSVTLISFFLRKEQNIWLYFITGALFILFIQKILPPERVWIYWAVPLSWQLCLLIKYTEHLKLGRILIGLSLVMYLWMSLKRIHSPHQWDEYKAVNNMLNHMQLSPEMHIFSNDDTYNVHIRYQEIKQQTDVDLQTDNYNNHQNYDWIILSTHSQPNLYNLTKYSLYHQDEFVRIYRK